MITNKKPYNYLINKLICTTAKVGLIPKYDSGKSPFNGRWLGPGFPNTDRKKYLSCYK